MSMGYKAKPKGTVRPFAIRFEPSARAAKQSFKDACDVNRIIEIFNKTGQLIHGNKGKPSYGDFTNLPSFQAAANGRVATQRFFDALPDDLRGKFKTVDGFFNFVSDPANRSEAVKLGLFKPAPTPVEKVTKVEVVNQAPPPDKGVPGK